LIIDNDKNAVGLIKTVGHDFSEFSFRDTDEDQDCALNIILKEKPDLIIINIESSNINFLEFLFEIHKLCEKKPYFISTSNLKDHAFDSYRYDFLDFILKPLSELSIRKSLLKFLKRNPIVQIETICLKSYKDYQYLNIDDILYLKADNNTTDFHMCDGRLIGAYKTLKVFENSLPKTFFRIHKSYIINKKCISRIHYGKSVCILNNEHEIPFTKTFISNIDLINIELSKNTMITLN